MYERLAQSLVLAAQSNISLMNNAVAVNLRGLTPHLRTQTALIHRGVSYDIFARECETGTTEDAFEQLLLRGGTKFWIESSRSTNKRKDLLTCELLGRSANGQCTAFLGTNGFWDKTLAGSIGSYRSAFAHSEIALPPFLTLDVPARIAPERALLGIQFAFLEGMEAGFLGVKKLMVLGALRSQGHPMISPEAEEALEQLFE
ncbi:MAG TPA: hypothetical protein VFX30_11220 [bacterium]|nr:hypothetical protein [bacterium]